MNDGYFAFKHQNYKKLTNLERAQIKRSDERYSNTCITDLPKMWSPNYKITKRLMFGFRVQRYMETILSG